MIHLFQHYQKLRMYRMSQMIHLFPLNLMSQKFQMSQTNHLSQHFQMYR
jgi:hypothetical protein